MYCVKKINKDLTWVGVNDRRLAMFEGIYSVPKGVSYNSYLLKDEKTVLFDTVDKAVWETFFENLEHELAGKKLDYLIIQHMEPDHSATLKEILIKYPEVIVVCNSKIKTMIEQFFDPNKYEFLKNEKKFLIVKEGEKLSTGTHELTFINAPMVHWPEVMVTYDIKDKILFSADAFGTFGALNGAIFADEVDFWKDYIDEARRYYANIVGKYGAQVQMLLKKITKFEIKMICPLHGFVWRTDHTNKNKSIFDYIEKYQKWSSYIPEETGVMIVYASIYGHTANAAEIISAKLRENGIKTEMFDVSVTPASEIVSSAFRWSHLVFASATYNMGIFITMEDLLRDLASHNIQYRTVAFVENGTWAATSACLMKQILEICNNLTFIDKSISIKSALKEFQIEEIDELVKTLSSSILL